MSLGKDFAGLVDGLINGPASTVEQPVLEHMELLGTPIGNCQLEDVPP